MKKLKVMVVVAVLFITGCASQRPWYNALICSVAGGAAGAAIGGGAAGGREAGYGVAAGALVGGILCAALTPVATPVDSDGDSVTDDKDQCPGTPPGVKVNQLGCPEREPIILKGVNFTFDSAELTQKSFAILDDTARILTKHPGLKVTIAGHTDSTGTADYNKNLSQRRAESVMNHLISRGVKSVNLTAVGFGEEQPIASNDEVEGRAMNRRVELQPQE